MFAASKTAAVSSAANYIEDVFSTYLYTGNGSTQTITNGIDTSTKGGMVWIKSRSLNTDQQIQDTVRGASKSLFTNKTDAELTQTQGFSAFGTSGFSLYFDNLAYGSTNSSGATYASWTFRKQPKFFDVVTWTGNGVAGRTVAHNLGAVPGCIIVKRTDADGNDWQVYHTSLGNTKRIYLNTSEVAATSTVWDNTTPTSTVFSVGTSSAVNLSGSTYVAYLFAHNAGGFGLTGTDNVISCGSFTTDGSGNATVSLGYEPQWVLIKSSSNADGWQMVDTMRGMAVSNGLYNGDQVLQSQASSAETSGAFVQPSATGFDITFYGSSRTYIYIAIRRGPMKVPTSGTSVFSPATSSATAGTPITTGFPIDLQIATERVGSTNNIFYDRLRGVSTTTTQSAQSLISNTDGTENSPTTSVRNWGSTGFEIDSRHASSSTVYENFRRAPSFFDEVCYTGTGASGQTKTHNLGVTPELMIIKNRGPAGYTQNWVVYPGPLGTDQYLYLNSTNGAGTFGGFWGNTPPTSTGFTVGNYQDTNASTLTYVAYLFATCAGVSKVGSFTGTGATQTISCGFTGGARFVMIKRTDSTGNWYYWDTARGMVSGTDPKLALNSDTAESNANWVYTTTGGFQIVTTDANVNASGGTYIFLAIA